MPLAAYARPPPCAGRRRWPGSDADLSRESQSRFDAFASATTRTANEAVKKRPPVLLTVVTVVYPVYLSTQLAVDFTPVLAGRLVLVALLCFFVLRGSRIAGYIAAVLCTLIALTLMVAAVATVLANALAAMMFIVLAVLLLAFSGYLVFSPAVRSYQGMAPGQPE